MARVVDRVTYEMWMARQAGPLRLRGQVKDSSLQHTRKRLARCVCHDEALFHTDDSACHVENGMRQAKAGLQRQPGGHCEVQMIGAW